jgi:predicted TIM-barrel fold metal-dependent hydrolase
VHTHIFPPEIVKGRERFFRNEPSFKLLYDSPGAKLATAEDLLEAMDGDGVDVSVSFGFPWESLELTRRHNDYVLESAAKYGSRILPLCCVNPLSGGALSEARRCLEAGARGLGELGVYGECDGEKALGSFQDLIDCARAFGVVMLIHANEPVGRHYPGKAPLGLGFFYALAGKALGVPIVLAHWGGGLGFYELMKREVKNTLASVYYDTAASPFLYRSSIYGHMAAIVGTEKIVMGSDYPLIPVRRYLDEMREAGLDQETFASVAGENARALFGLSSKSSG